MESVPESLRRPAASPLEVSIVPFLEVYLETCQLVRGENETQIDTRELGPRRERGKEVPGCVTPQRSRVRRRVLWGLGPFETESL